MNDLARIDEDLARFRRDYTKNIQSLLVALVGPERAKIGAAKIGMALASAARSARDPAAIMDCSPGSIMGCVAAAIAVDMYPRTSNSPVWLVPKKGELQFWISAVGYCTLAQRAGLALRAVAVHVDDPYRVEFGDIVEHESGEEPQNMREIAGAYVTVKRISDGVVIARPWLGINSIERRRKKALSQGIWSEWPVEMTMKTAIKYSIARGIIVIDLPEMGMAHDAEPHEYEQVRDVASIGASTRATPTGAAELLGIPETVDLAEDLEQQKRQPETVKTDDAEMVDDLPDGPQEPARTSTRRRSSRGAP